MLGNHTMLIIILDARTPLLTGRSSSIYESYKRDSNGLNLKEISHGILSYFGNMQNYL